MKNKKLLFIGLIIAAVTIYYTFRNVEINELIKTIASIKYYYLLPIIILTYATYTLRVYRWACLVRPIKEDIITKNLYSPLMIGFLGNLLPARAGEFIRAYLLSKGEGIKFSTSFATIFVERLFDVLAMLALSTVFLFTETKRFDNVAFANGLMLNDVLKKFALLSIALTLFIIIFSILIIYFRDKVKASVSAVFSFLPKKITDKLMGLIDSFGDGFSILKNFKELAVITLYTILIWVTIMIANYIFLLLFDINDLPFISIPIITLSICIAITLLPTPGFIGSFQIGCVLALTNIFNVPEPLSASYGLVSWFVGQVYLVVVGVYFIIKGNISLKEISKGGE